MASTLAGASVGGHTNSRAVAATKTMPSTNTSTTPQATTTCQMGRSSGFARLVLRSGLHLGHEGPWPARTSSSPERVEPG